MTRYGFTFAGSGTYAGLVRDVNGYAVKKCPHHHTRPDLARACAERTLTLSEED